MILPKLPDFYVDDVITRALAEDVNYIDVTTDLLIERGSAGKAFFVAKADGVLSGIFAALRVFTLLDGDIKTKPLFTDGEVIENGNVVAQISGSAVSMLKAERVALNILQHMSGVATFTRLCADAVQGTRARLADTRKTLPGLRALQKYAVLCGGGSNHRYNLSAAALIKDNHIDAYGGITAAVEALRSRAGHTVVIEVEVRSLEELAEALSARAQIIMLDNMPLDMMRQAVKLADGRAKLEASGNVTAENIRAVAETGVDIISMGSLTHSAKALDISMKWAKESV
ncbi:MAG: carboxylating nicotinate-nucleotide diphosphorylase [Oscillospiraceae bacterium]|jgi:nicotinate-nucleotide pyrophosphorylase (carboxylating)|nr:carboxylating nicotinate-nucleotide diphosphorylase [Oscillospiraceae bacterium]